MSGASRALLATDRLRALVDGVLAIVLTILVLGIDVPNIDFGAGETDRFLRELGHQLHPYFASFGLVAAYWVQHAVIVAFVPRANRVFVWLNIAFLLPLSLLPFLTSLRVTDPTELIPCALFGAGQVACGLLLLATWRYGTAPGRFVRAPLDPAVLRSMSVRIALGPMFCVVGATTCLWEPHLGSLFFLCVPLLYLSHRKVDAAWRDAAGEA
jgi:uncharacterized membrane protein